MSIPPNGPVPNPLDIMIALNHGEDPSHITDDVGDAKSFSAKCLSMEEMRKKNLSEWMMMEHMLRRSKEKLKKRHLARRKKNKNKDEESANNAQALFDFYEND